MGDVKDSDPDGNHTWSHTPYRRCCTYSSSPFDLAYSARSVSRLVSQGSQ
jgi:hypothetical protein